MIIERFLLETKKMDSLRSFYSDGLDLSILRIQLRAFKTVETLLSFKESSCRNELFLLCNQHSP